ncbi:MAG: hypothetical protein EBZ58_02165 [Bacteroidetes bacterium]|nr:hypothetical protein [Bacteroidota bacterium]
MKKEFVTRYNYIIFKVLFLTTHVRDTSFHSKSLERFANSKESGVMLDFRSACKNISSMGLRSLIGFAM